MIRFNPSLIGTPEAKPLSSAADRSTALTTATTSNLGGVSGGSMPRPSFSFSMSTGIGGESIVGGNKAVTATKRAKNLTTFSTKTDGELTDDLIDKSMRRNGNGNTEDDEGRTRIAMRPAVDALLQSFNGPQVVSLEKEDGEYVGDAYEDDDDNDGDDVGDIGDVTSSFFLRRMLEKNKREDGGMLDVAMLGRSMLSGSEIGVATGKGRGSTKSHVLGKQSQSSVVKQQLDVSALQLSKSSIGIKCGGGNTGGKGVVVMESGGGTSLRSERKASALNLSLKSAADLSGMEHLITSGSLEGHLVDASSPTTSSTTSVQGKPNPCRTPVDTATTITSHEKQISKGNKSNPMPLLPKSKRCQASTLPKVSQNCKTTKTQRKKRDEEAVADDEPDPYFGSVSLDLPPPSLLQYEHSPGFQRAVVLSQGSGSGGQVDLYDFTSPPPRVPIGSPPIRPDEDDDDLDLDSDDEEFAMVSPQRTALPSEVPFSHRATTVRCPQPPAVETSPPRGSDEQTLRTYRRPQPPSSISPSSTSEESDANRGIKRFTGIRSPCQLPSPQVTSPHFPNSVSVLSPGDLEIFMLPPGDITMRPQSPRKHAHGAASNVSNPVLSPQVSPKSSPQVSPTTSSPRKGARQLHVKLTNFQ